MAVGRQAGRGAGWEGRQANEASRRTEKASRRIDRDRQMVRPVGGGGGGDGGSRAEEPEGCHGPALAAFRNLSSF